MLWLLAQCKSILPHSLINYDLYMHILQLYTQHSCTSVYILYVTCTCTQLYIRHMYMYTVVHTVRHMYMYTVVHIRHTYVLYDEHTLHHSFIQLHHFCQISLNPPFSCTQSIPSSELFSHLPPLFELLTARVDYLFCRATTLQGSRVGGSSGIVTSTSSVRPIGSMNVTKSIMEWVLHVVELEVFMAPVALIVLYNVHTCSLIRIKRFL